MPIPLKQGDGAYPVYLVDVNGNPIPGSGGLPVTIGGPLGRQADTLSVSTALSIEDVALLNSLITSAARPLVAVDFTIANAASLSAAVDLATLGVARISMPAAWTAANLTFQTSQDNVTFQDLYDSYGIEYTVIAAAARNIVLPPSDFVGLRYLKVRSGTASVPVAQGGARTITLITRAF